MLRVHLSTKFNDSTACLVVYKTIEGFLNTGTHFLGEKNENKNKLNIKTFKM